MLTGNVRSQRDPMGHYKSASRGYWIWRGTFLHIDGGKYSSGITGSIRLSWSLCTGFCTYDTLVLLQKINLSHLITWFLEFILCEYRMVQPPCGSYRVP